MYVHPDMTEYQDQIVEIGEWPHDELRLDAFIGGQYLFTAEFRDQASPALIADALTKRKKHLADGATRTAGRSKRDGLRLRALHAANTEPVVTNAMTEAEALARKRELGHVDIRSPADVLGFTDRLNQPGEDL
jgi:hypothetical protein